VADIGTGTGILALELARLGLHVVAVDHSPRMLTSAREKMEREGVETVELREGEAHQLPLADGEVHAAFAHMVLHYLPAPGDALREMARIVRPGGTVVVVDFVRHEHEWMRDDLGMAWLGFERDEVETWFRNAGLAEPAFERHESASRSRDLPATFIASGRRPGK